MKSRRPGTSALCSITFAGAVACTAILAAPAAAQVSIGVGISLPTPIVFVAPPQVVVLPGFDIYVAPDIAEEIYFVDGYWWRPWQGRWYRSASYDNGWGYYDSVPYFYSNVRRGWRDDYHNHRWEGQDWNYQRMSSQRVEQNWSSWKSNNYWQGQQNWGVPNMKGGKQRHDKAARQPDSRPHSSQQAPQIQSPASQKQSSQPKAAQQHRSSQPKAAPQQQHRSAQPKAAKPQHHSAQPQGHGEGGQGREQGQGGQHGGGEGKK